MPPGTGDALLTFSQEIDIDGAVIITTPQDIAIIDVKKGIEMFKRTNVKILGIIENMSSFTSDNGIEHFIFGKGGGERIANIYKIQLLAKIKLYEKLRMCSDNGTPYVEFFSNEELSRTFIDIAKKLEMNLSLKTKKNDLL
jgi:ATP-binding protein involved in chromosome partitioning